MCGAEATRKGSLGKRVRRSQRACGVRSAWGPEGLGEALRPGHPHLQVQRKQEL